MRNKSLLYRWLLFFSACFFAIGLGSVAQASETLKLSYVPISNESDGATFIMTSKIKVVNEGTTSIHNITVTVDSTNGVSTDAGMILLGDIDAGKTKVSENNFTITSDSAQETSDKNVIWNVQYENSEGNTITLLIPLTQ